MNDGHKIQMHVLYEGSVYEIMRRGGVGRYFAELINRLPADVDPTLVAPVPQPDDISNQRLAFVPVQTNPPNRLVRRFWRSAQHRRISQLIATQQPDLIHWTYYVGLCRRPVKPANVPSVVSVYDFIHEQYPETDPSGLSSAWKDQAIRSADHLCCISQTTHDELCQRYPSLSSRASVTPLGSSLSNVIPCNVPPALQGRRFVLFVGRREGYKNFEVVWRAWQNLRSSGEDLDLVLVGPGFKRSEFRKLGTDPTEHRGLHLFENASDELLKAMYQHSAAFVFPSKMEGFGLPALEAMLCGTPVLASNCQALREVVGNAGYFFNSTDPSELSDLLREVARDTLCERDNVIARGYQRARQFSWENTARLTHDAYCRVALTANSRFAA